MHNIKLILEYDGTNYRGWQSQPKGETVQGIIASALNILLKEEVQLIGAGRTDAGVHAKGQVANFYTTKRRDPARLRWSLNALLPSDIRILAAEKVDLDFQARRDAKGRKYSYYILNHPFSSAFYHRFSWWIARPLDKKAIDEAITYLVGKKDFAAFTREREKSTVRTVKEFSFSKADFCSGMLQFSIVADSFLHHMVRLIVGTLVKVGLGKISPQAVLDILASQDVRQAGPRAPARGLFLEKVEY